MKHDRFNMSLHEIRRAAPALFSIGNEKEIRELVERAIKRGWCKRPAQRLDLTREHEIAALKSRLLDLESEAVVE